MITITGGPNATANIPGPRNDAADFYGIAVALIAIMAAIALTRIVFGRRPRGGRRPPSPSGPPTRPTGPAGPTDATEATGTSATTGTGAERPRP